MYRTLIPFNITISPKPYAYTLAIGLAKNASNTRWKQQDQCYLALVCTVRFVLSINV